MADSPVPRVIFSPRNPMNPSRIDTPVPKELLTAGDHNGSTFYKYQKFQAAVLGAHSLEVSLQDGIWVVRMGHAAQQSAEERQVVEL